MRMNTKLNEYIEKLASTHQLSLDAYEYVITHRDEEAAEWLARKARDISQSIYGKSIYVRGLIEFTNICKNDCFYCGIRKDASCSRYRLDQEDILKCCAEGYDLGFRTFVLQGGEDAYFNDARLCDIVSKIHTLYPDCAITLSVGERNKESYQRLFDAGASRYLLRHETADRNHYHKLHPSSMSFSHRMRCIQDLRDIGYDVGIGMMVQSPYQTAHHLAEDLKFVETFHPEMCGIGPYITAKDTPFHDQPSGSVELTLYLISILRLIYPPMLIPATTALGTLDPVGREKGVLAGANVVMPNLSPVGVRRKYQLYDNKICVGDESAQCRHCLENRMDRIGYTVVTDRGDIKLWD